MRSNVNETATLCAAVQSCRSAAELVQWLELRFPKTPEIWLVAMLDYCHPHDDFIRRVARLKHWSRLLKGDAITIMVRAMAEGYDARAAVPVPYAEVVSGSTCDLPNFQTHSENSFTILSFTHNQTGETLNYVITTIDDETFEEEKRRAIKAAKRADSRIGAFTLKTHVLSAMDDLSLATLESY